MYISAIEFFLLGFQGFGNIFRGFKESSKRKKCQGKLHNRSVPHDGFLADFFFWGSGDLLGKSDFFLFFLR